MSAVDRLHASAWRLAVAAASLLTLLALARPAQAQPTIVGYLSNFDVPNNVKDSQGQSRETEGFEIQIEGVQAADVIYAFGEAGALSGPPAPCYIRYCRPQIIPYATGIYVRWQAGWDPAGGRFTSNFNIPGMTLTSAGTPPVASGVFFAGHQCWSLGLGAQYPQGGCEHFGVSLSRNPGQTTYRWLVAELDAAGQPTGVLTYDGGAPLGTGTTPPAAAKSLPILAPVAQVPAAGQVNAGQVQAMIQAPAPDPQPPAALPHRYGHAQWVKVYKKEVDRQADLDELVGGHPNENVPGIHGQDHDANAVAETEWKLLQMDVKNPDKGGSRLVNHGSSGSKSHAVVRRYEFYQYAGPVVPPGGTSGGGKGGGQVFSTDDQEASQCQRDPVTNECTEPGPGELGDFIGAHNAAQNLNLNDGRADQTITFGPLADLVLPHAALTLTASASSNLGVTFGAVGACSIAGNTLSIDGAGGCVVTASQPGDASFAPASDVLRSFIIGKAEQTITFALPAGPFTYGDAPFQISATSSSGLPVSFAASGACSVQDTAVTISGAGMCQVVASQAGDTNYSAAADVPQSITVAHAAQTITFGALASKTFGDAPFAVSAAGGASGNVVTFAAAGSCSVAGNTVTIGGAGSCTVTASQAGDANYSAAADVPQSFSIAQASQTITFGVLANRTYGDAAFAVSATGGASGNVVTFAAAGSCSVAANTVTIIGAGSCTITASQAGDANYLVAADVPQSFSIAKGSSVVTWAAPADIAQGTPLGAVQLNATANVPGSFAYSPAAGTVLAAGAGQALSVAFTPADSANYTSATASVRINVIAATPPPSVNPIVPIADQYNGEGDRVRLKVQIASSESPVISARHDDDDDTDDCQARGVFTAMNLPPGLEIERKHGVIRGRLGFSAAGDYHVTVSFTRDGVTFTRSFTWHVADVMKRHRHDERDTRHYR